MRAEVVALFRLFEGRLRTSRSLRRLLRASLAVSVRRSKEVRTFVRLRVMRLI